MVDITEFKAFTGNAVNEMPIMAPEIILQFISLRENLRKTKLLFPDLCSPLYFQSKNNVQ
jgi:hypothetical protein